MRNRVFGVVATAVGFVMIVAAKGQEVVLLGAVVVIAVGLGFMIYGDGR